jgi:hypothetical protein
MSAEVDFVRMSRVSAKFHGRKGKRREGDVIWRLPSGSGIDIYLYLLVEFQSETDFWMAVRTQVYEGLLWQQVIAEQKLKSGDRLPPVLTVVLHNGESRWTAPTALSEQIALTPDSPLWPWQPQVRYHLLDMGAFSGDELAQQDSLVALLFRLEQRHDPSGLAGLIDEVIGWFRRHPGYVDLKRLFTELVRQAIEGFGASLPVPDDLVEMKTMLATQGPAWQRQWFAEGKAEGMAEGEAKGKAVALVRLLEKRGGPLPDEIRQRIFAADAATLEVWFDRAIEASDLNSVFAPS